MNPESSELIEALGRCQIKIATDLIKAGAMVNDDTASKFLLLFLKTNNTFNV